MDEIKSKDIKSDINFGNSIKSEYNLNEIFSFLEKTNTLNIIIYNKQLQNRLKINLEYYKKISGKYKVGKKDGLGKIFILNTDKLIFEGE